MMLRRRFFGSVAALAAAIGLGGKAASGATEHCKRDYCEPDALTLTTSKALIAGVSGEPVSVGDFVYMVDKRFFKVRGSQSPVGCVSAMVRFSRDDLCLVTPCKVML